MTRARLKKYLYYKRKIWATLGVMALALLQKAKHHRLQNPHYRQFWSLLVYVGGDRRPLSPLVVPRW
jgi:hypothetical protein